MELLEESYLLIHSIAQATAKKYGFDKQTGEDVAQDVVLALYEILIDKEKKLKIRNLIAYARGIIIKKFAEIYRQQRKRELLANDIDWISDITTESADMLLNNQAKSFSSIVDDDLGKNPHLFTKREKQLWDLFKQQKYSPKEMMTIMEVNASAFYMAKRRLIQKITSIYGKKAPTNLS